VLPATREGWLCHQCAFRSEPWRLTCHWADRSPTWLRGAALRDGTRGGPHANAAARGAREPVLGGSENHVHGSTLIPPHSDTVPRVRKSPAGAGQFTFRNSNTGGAPWCCSQRRGPGQRRLRSIAALDSVKCRSAPRRRCSSRKRSRKFGLFLNEPQVRLLPSDRHDLAPRRHARRWRHRSCDNRVRGRCRCTSGVG
jgi:hypothetical protein